MNKKFQVLIVCPQCNGEDVGEAWCGYQWVSRLAEKCDVTLLTVRFPNRPPPSIQLPDVRTFEWKASPYLSRFPRINSSIKPWYLLFYFQVRSWLGKMENRGLKFDIQHHITPTAMRFPSPLAGFDHPYIIGPVGGGVTTPVGFAGELGTEPFYTRLRQLDGFRLRYDPLLRRTYEKAEAVICTGPYAINKLDHLNITRAVLEYEVGVNDLASVTQIRRRKTGELRMLHVGRTVRTKGLRDAIKAMAQLQDLPNVTLDIAGDGEDMEACQKEAKSLGLCSRINFLGRISREEVENLYKQADLFLFPSFREPTGGVLFEAMRHGLPVITTNVGGPGHIVTDACGVRVPAINPEQLANNLADEIRRLAVDKQALTILSKGARARVSEIGLWDHKIERMLELYSQIAANT